MGSTTKNGKSEMGQNLGAEMAKWDKFWWTDVVYYSSVDIF